jgi:hypothetical protein
MQLERVRDVVPDPPAPIPNLWSTPLAPDLRSHGQSRALALARTLAFPLPLPMPCRYRVHSLGHGTRSSD